MPTTMRRFSSDRFNLRARPWLALWLLPYLLMSIAASAHNHGVTGDSSDHNARYSLTQRTVQTLTAPVVIASDAAQDVFCLACQWAGLAAAILTPAMVLVLVVGSLPVAAIKLLSSRRALARVAVRGPPRS